MRTIDLLFNEYGESHKNSTNKLIHWICVPLIFWSIVGFISLIPSNIFFEETVFQIRLVSLIAMILVSVFYFRLSGIIGLLMVVFMLFINYTTFLVNQKFGNNAWIVYLSVFIITWIFQFIGHKIEGKKPSFIKDLQFLLVGPIWLLHFLMKKIGMKY